MKWALSVFAKRAKETSAAPSNASESISLPAASAHCDSFVMAIIGSETSVSATACTPGEVAYCRWKRRDIGAMREEKVNLKSSNVAMRWKASTLAVSFSTWVAGSTVAF